MKNSMWIITAVLLVLSIGINAQENWTTKYIYPESYNSQSKSSVGLKYFSASIGNAILYGWRHVNYNSEKFFVGGTGYTGQMGDISATGTFSYGGLVLGYDKRLGNRVHADYGVVAGGGGGKYTEAGTTTSGGGIILEPWFGLNWRIGKTTDFNCAATYLYMPNNDKFTGYTVALRFDFALQ
ncbi:MAG: hypothetical protein HN353_06595 [Bdellovibrionales bacterium]|nr:hypothetical protein [Bdellovibrionales bacterium]MBT3526445.1 hypothetical protein [Bdellovibrionales bacterium]MBT7668737.1 hypothetical protein [Bdellovibrionales bacterium]MBT7766229.1 hypothetical protein [Bdellovibrionales bacterium]